MGREQSFVSHSVLNNPEPNLVGALHCQEGQESVISIAVPATKEA